jgi:hypothetical protein
VGAAIWRLLRTLCLGELMANEFAETYRHAADGTISMVIENRSRGHACSCSLGALR